MTTYREGERKLLEITAGSPENSRFAVCYWLKGEWWLDDAVVPIAYYGYKLVAVHDLPERACERSELPTDERPS